MEIAAGNCFVVIGENNGIIRHGVNLAADGIVNVFDRIAACSVNLRSAAQCICILNLSGNGIKRKLAAFKQSEQVLCAVDLSLVAANSMNLGIIGLLDAEKCFRSHCAGDIRSLCELNGVIYRKTADGSHYLSSVNECKAFLGRKFEDAPGEVRRITAALRRETLNIALVGMPSCGKSTLGRLLAKQLGRPLVDLDEEIVKADGRSIPDIFAAEGEEGFRAKEAAQIARFGKEKGLVLSCGGGAVKRAENVRALRQNGVVLFIDRPVEALAVGGNRPLSSSAEALRTMEAQRRPLYRAAADAVVPNTGTLEDALRAAMEALDEIFDS